MTFRKDMTGFRNGSLFVLSYDKTERLWNCQCDCGNTRRMSTNYILRVKSCGCGMVAATSRRNFKHGGSYRASRDPMYGIWCEIIRRCTDPKNSHWEYYGGRGITICDRWRYGENGAHGYVLFKSDVGPRPSPSHSIDRINNSGHYEPSNCRWATKEQQSRNRRNIRYVEFRGKRLPLYAAAQLAGLPRKLVEDRIRCGWSIDRALTTKRLPLFGGVGAKRFSHSDQAESLMGVSGV